MEREAKGKIIKGVGGLYTVRLTNNTCAPSERLVTCAARGSFRHDGITLLAGDNVKVLINDGSADTKPSAVIDSVDERRNSLIRPPLANLDYIFVTMAATHPAPILTTVDKMICIAEFNKIEPVVVITKADLNGSEAERIAQIYRSSGFDTFVISSESGEGIDELGRFIDEHIRCKLAAFAGASGVGKSTLMNSLFPHLSLSTSDISRKIERGRHTTRAVELFPLSDDAECGYIADTPGFSMLDFERFDFFELSDLPQTMREFTSLMGKCKYTKCSHTKEEGCAIVEAVRDGSIQKSRHDSFLELYSVLKAKKKW